MAYLASRGDIKTTVYQQTTSSYSYYTDRLNIISPSITSAIPTYSSMSGTHKTSGESYIRSSTDGHIMTYEYHNTSHAGTLWPDGSIYEYIANSSGFQVSKSFTTMIPQQVTTSVARYSGSQHCNPVDATRKLCLRTGTGEYDVVKYGLTTRTDAKDYCGLRMNIDGQVAYIGRSEAQGDQFTKTRNNALTRSTYTSTITSTVSSISSYRTYTSSGNIDNGSYIVSSPGGTYAGYGMSSMSSSWSSSLSGTTSYVESRTSSWPYSATTSRIISTTFTRTSGASLISSSFKYANSTYTSYYSYYSGSIKTSYWHSGHRLTKCKNEGEMVINNDGNRSFWYYYSIYETWARSGRKMTQTYTLPATTYATTTRHTTSMTTYVNSFTSTYASYHNSLSTSVATNSGSYTTSSLEGYVSRYARYSTLSSIFRERGVVNDYNLLSADCLFNIAGVYTSCFTTNQYEMKLSYTTNQSSQSSTGPLSDFVSSANGNRCYITAQSGNKSSFYSGDLVTVSADSPIFSITRSGGYAVSWSTDFRKASIYGVDQVISVSTTRSRSLFNDNDSTETFTSGHFDRQYAYTTGVTTSVSSSTLNLAAGSYQRVSVDGRQYTVSVPNGYITRRYSGNTVTDQMATYTTSQSESYRSYTTTHNEITYTLHQQTGGENKYLAAAYADYYETYAPGGGIYVSTTTSYDYLTRYFTRTYNATMTLTDYLNARKMLSNVTTGTRTTAYTTSRNTTYTAANLTASSLMTRSWYQRTTVSGSMSSMGYPTSKGGAYNRTVTCETVSNTYPRTISYTTNYLAYSYTGTINTSYTSTGYQSSTIMSTDGYTMSASRSSVSFSTNTTTMSTYRTGTFTTMSAAVLLTSSRAYYTLPNSSWGNSSSYVYTSTNPAYMVSLTMNGDCLVNRTWSGYSFSIAALASSNPITMSKSGVVSTRTTVAYHTYTHVLDSDNHVGYYSYPETVSGISVSSSNYKTYSWADINTILTKSSSWSRTYSHGYLTAVGSQYTNVTSSRTSSVTTQHTTSSSCYGSAKAEVYSAGNWVSSYYTLENLVMSSCSRTVGKTKWVNEFFSVSKCHTRCASGPLNTVTRYSTSSTSSRTTSSATFGPYNQGTLTNYNTYSIEAASSYNYTISTSSTLSSRTSRTTYANRTVSSQSDYYTYYQTYDRHLYTSYTASYASTWTGVEVFSTKTFKYTVTSPYILTSSSQKQYGEEVGIYTTNNVSYMSLYPAMTTGNLCTYSYHTNSYYSSASTLKTDSAYTHGFICDSSLSNVISNSSATTYELNYTGSEVFVSAANPTVAFSMSDTSSLDFNSFTHLVGNVAASLGLLVSYSKATLSKSYLSYLTSSILQHYTTTVHNYEM